MKLSYIFTIASIILLLMPIGVLALTQEQKEKVKNNFLVLGNTDIIQKINEKIDISQLNTGEKEKLSQLVKDELIIKSTPILKEIIKNVESKQTQEIILEKIKEKTNVPRLDINEKEKIVQLVEEKIISMREITPKEKMRESVLIEIQGLIKVIPKPIFTLNTYGKNDCDRVRILTHLPQTKLTLYKLYNIYAIDYNFKGVDAMVSYCTKNGANMDEEINMGYYRVKRNYD